jgi:hypothetical protein
MMVQSNVNEYKEIRDNIPIMNENGIGLKYLRCGLCNLNNVKDWEAHERTEEHKSSFTKMEILRKVTDGHIDIRELIRASHVMTLQEVSTMFNLCLLSPKDEVIDQQRLNRRKVEKFLGKR